MRVTAPEGAEAGAGPAGGGGERQPWPEATGHPRSGGRAPRAVGLNGRGCLVVVPGLCLRATRSGLLRGCEERPWAPRSPTRGFSPVAGASPGGPQPFRGAVNSSCLGFLMRPGCLRLGTYTHGILKYFVAAHLRSEMSVSLYCPNKRQ